MKKLLPIVIFASAPWVAQAGSPTDQTGSGATSGTSSGSQDASTGGSPSSNTDGGPDSGSASPEAGTSTSDSSTLYSVPDIPALSAINATSNKIDRPASATGLAASLANIIDTDGTVKSGVGIEVSPHAFGIDRTWSWFQYRHDWWRRVLSQSALSVGTIKASQTSMTSGADTTAAVGLRVVLWDQSDPLLRPSYRYAVKFARDHCPDEGNPQAVAECRTKTFNSFDHWEDAPWNAGSLFAAFAETWDFADSTLGSHKLTTLSSWVAFGLPIGSWGQFTLGTVWDHGWYTADHLSVASRLRLGDKKVRAVFDETWFARRDPNTPYARWAAGGEFQVLNGAWLTVSVGTDLGGMTSQNISVLSSVKWGFSPSPSWQ